MRQECSLSEFVLVIQSHLSRRSLKLFKASNLSFTSSFKKKNVMNKILELESDTALLWITGAGQLNMFH